MRAFFFLLLLFSVQAFAELSIIEFKVRRHIGVETDQHFQIILHGQSPHLDEIHRLGMDGTWHRVFVGPINYVTLPEGGQVTKFYGPRARTDVRIRFGDYDLLDPEASVGVRVRSGDNLVLLLPFKATIVPWPGQVQEVVPLDREYDIETGQGYSIFSVKGREAEKTYMILNDDYAYPLLLTHTFRREKLGARMLGGRVILDSLNQSYDLTYAPGTQTKVTFQPADAITPVERERAARRTFGNGLIDRLFFRRPSAPPTTVTIMSEERLAFLRELIRPPSAGEVLDELIALLDDREPLESMANAEVLVRRAIRGVLFRQFPPLRELEQTDPSVKRDIDKLLRSMTYLWFARKAVSGELIRNTFIQRLEAAVEKRTKCELSLLQFEGPGSHAAYYFRGEAMSSLNALYRKLYK